jgi:hypothetical protein
VHIDQVPHEGSSNHRDDLAYARDLGSGCSSSAPRALSTAASRSGCIPPSVRRAPAGPR